MWNVLSSLQKEDLEELIFDLCDCNYDVFPA